VNETIGRTPPPLQRVMKWMKNGQQIASLTPRAYYIQQHINKLPHNIIQCKAYGIPNAQNKTCKMLNGS